MGNPSPALQHAAGPWPWLSSGFGAEQKSLLKLRGWEMMAPAPPRLGHDACTRCDVLSVFRFKAVCKMFVLTRCSSFPSPGWVGGAQGREPKDNPSPAERRDRSLKAQGPIPLPQLSLDGTGAPPLRQSWKRGQGANPAWGD